MWTVSLIEDDDDYRELLSRAIRSDKHLRLLHAYATAEEALKHLPQDKPDVALVDIKLPTMDGIECIRRLRAIIPALPTRFMILTGYEDDNLLFKAVKAGLHGYLLKGCTSDRQLLAAIKEVMTGGGPLTPIISRKLIQSFEDRGSCVPELSKREQEVLQRLAQGLMDKEISHELSISQNTLRTYLGSIYHKLHVRSRTDAAVYFVQHGDRP